MAVLSAYDYNTITIHSLKVVNFQALIIDYFS